MVTGFNHSGFVVKDIEKMVEFYRDALGLTVLREVNSVAPPEGDHTGIPGARRTLVFVGKAEGEHVLELVQFDDPPSPDSGRPRNNHLGAAHVCFNVEDLEKLHRGLTARGIEFVTAPKFRETPEGGRRGVCYAATPRATTSNSSRRAEARMPFFVDVPLSRVL